MKTFLLFLMLLACPALADVYEVSGQVTGPDGEPVARAHLSFALRGGPPYISGVTLRDGTFSVTLEEGTYLLKAKRDGYAQTYLDSIEVKGGPEDGIELRMARSIPVQGRVAIPPGRRVLFAVALQTWAVGRAPIVETIKVAKDGSFRGTLGPGEWQIQVRAEGSRDNIFLWSKARIDLEAGQPAPFVEIELPLGETGLEGRFVETYSHQWAVRLVRDLPNGSWFEAEVGNRDGGFRFEGLAPGFYTLQIHEYCCNSGPKLIHEQPAFVPSTYPVPVRLGGGRHRAQAIAVDDPPRP